MIERRIRRLPGMRDVSGPVYQRTNQTIDAVTLWLADRGYVVIDTPLLEETQLFVRKAGGELTSRMYNFTDPGGGKVSLRPEFTSSVIRYFVQDRESLTLPVRWQYSGPVFRYEHGQDGGHCQFTQVGAELIGMGGVTADAEIVYTAWAGLEQVGLGGHRLHIGHLGVLGDLLNSFGLSEPAKLFIISNVHSLKGGGLTVEDLRERAEEVGVLTGDFGIPQAASLRDMSEQAAQEFAQRLLTRSMPAPVGRRTTEQIVDRLIRKLRDANDPDRFDEALALVSQLGRLDGPPAMVMEEARRVTSAHGLDVDVFDELDELLDALVSLGVPQDLLVLDLGLARGISYYSGVVFDLTSPSSTEEISVGGGGRYDGLIRALGGIEDVSALGFAYNLDRVVDAVERMDPVPSEASVDS